MLLTIPSIQALLSASTADQETHSLLQDIESLTYLAMRETNSWNIAGGTGIEKTSALAYSMDASQVRIERETAVDTLTA